MVDAQKVLSLTPDELNLAKELADLREKAKHFVSLIKEVWTFKMGEKRIAVGNKGAEQFLTYDGCWELAVYGKPEFSMQICEAEIFKLLQAKYLKDHQLPIDIDTEKLAAICCYFNGLIEITNKKAMTNKLLH